MSGRVGEIERDTDAGERKRQKERKRERESELRASVREFMLQMEDEGRETDMWFNIRVCEKRVEGACVCVCGRRETEAALCVCLQGRG